MQTYNQIVGLNHMHIKLSKETMQFHYKQLLSNALKT